MEYCIFGHGFMECGLVISIGLDRIQNWVKF
jgi:hypothetical protein